MYTATSSGRDRRGTEVVIIACPACGYFEEHFIDRGLAKAGRTTGAGNEPGGPGASPRSPDSGVGDHQLVDQPRQG